VSISLHHVPLNVYLCLTSQWDRKERLSPLFRIPFMRFIDFPITQSEDTVMLAKMAIFSSGFEEQRVDVQNKRVGEMREHPMCLVCLRYILSLLFLDYCIILH
jgi:hypothetical protein